MVQSYTLPVQMAKDVLAGYNAVKAPHYTFGIVDPKGRSYTQRGPCHAGLNTSEPPNKAAVWSVLPAPITDEVLDDPNGVNEHKLFIHWLFSETLSPYKDFLPLHDDLDFIEKHGFIFADLSIPANMLINFCIASRFSQEFPYHRQTWYKLVRSGIQPSLAFWLASAFAVRGKDGYAPAFYNNGHSAIDQDTPQEVYQNFIFGTPDKKHFNELYNVNPRYLPCNVVWGVSKNGFGHTITSGTSPSLRPFFKKTYEGLYTPFKGSRVFGEDSDQIILTYNNLLELARHEQRRLKIDYIPDRDFPASRIDSGLREAS